MNINDAYKELLKGNEIRLKYWAADIFIALDENQTIKTYLYETVLFEYSLDILSSNNWIVIDEDNTEISFIEAIEKLKEGKKLRLSHWKEDMFLFAFPDCPQILLRKRIQRENPVMFDDLISDKWEVIE